MKIKQPVKEYNPFAIAEQIDDFWARTYAYRRTKNSRTKMDKLFFVDGPPFVTNRFRISLARNKIIKDCYLRFMRAQGFNVMDRPGFDMHGLPVEVKVEESLGVSYRTQIEEIGVERFVEECKAYAGGNLEEMKKQFRELGIWLDWEKPYLTSDNSYIESVWWSIKEAHKKNHLEKKKQVTAWCSRCESPLTKGEVLYKEKKGHSVYFKIPIKGKRDEYILVWTTTPWTFAGALAIAVNPEYKYARVAVRQGGRKSTIIVLESQVEKITKMAGVEAYEIIDSVKGRDLENLEFFHPLMADIPFHKTAKGDSCHKVMLLDSVYESDTGSVYISPGFGTADFMVGTERSIPIFSPVDERGLFTTEVGIKYAGQNVEEGNTNILADMKSLRFVFASSAEDHKFGHCWRCDTPIIHRATEQWFLNADGINKIMRKTIRGTSWLPECFGASKINDKTANLNDWCISRQRYWGTPLPIWECIADVCGHIEVVGSRSELEGASGYREDMDLHKPAIDSISLECPKCGGLMKRIPDIVDVWFDSSIASWGQLGYPKKKAAFKDLWPGDWISEEHSQFKGWFLNQMFTGTMVLNKIPFKKAFVHESLLEEPQPLQVEASGFSDIRKIVGMHGPDALRLYLLGLDPCTKNIFDPGKIKNAHHLLNILWNSYVFSATYMSMDNWDPDNHSPTKVRSDLQPEDVWILSRIETLNHRVRKEMESSRFDCAAELISSFILEDLSRTYIKLVRERAWREDKGADKDALFFTLRETLRKLAVISSPFIPYLSEHIYQQLDAGELSISMVPWPDVDAENLSESSERYMNQVREIVKTSQKLRQELAFNLRWPARKMTISASNEDVTEAVRMFERAIKRQVNAKELEIVPENQEWTGQELIVVPNPNIIGKAYKQRESKIARMLKVLPAKEIKAKIEAGEYSLGIEGELIRILPEMVRFETKLPEGVVSTEFSNGTIYLDTVIDDDIMAEGYAREIIRRIQQMRKDMELDPEEYISISIKFGERIIELLEKWFEKIADSARAAEMEIVDEIEEDDYIVEWPIGKETVLIGITSLNIKKAMDEFLVIKEVDHELALAIVESGIATAETFLQTEREELLRIPGMTHSKLRKIREFLETPEDKRAGDEQTCPLCVGQVEPGSVICRRCGKNLIADEELMVEPVDEYEDEEYYYDDVTARERIRIGKRKKPEPEKVVQPEDEIVRMATKPREELTPEDVITSEIMSDISAEDVAEEVPDRVPEVAAAADADEKLHLPEPEKGFAPKALEKTEPPSQEEEVASQPTPAPEPPKAAEEPAILRAEEEIERIEPEELVEEDMHPEEEKVEEAAHTEVDAIKPDELHEEAKTPVQEQAEVIVPQPVPMPEPPKDDEPAAPGAEEDIERIEPEELAAEEHIEPAEPEHGAKSDIIDSDVDRLIASIAETFEIKQSTAKELVNNGYDSMEALSKASEEDLRDIKGIGKVTARRIVQKFSDEETKMCALCNAIVPSDSPVCTRCGVKFLPKKEGVEAGISKAADKPSDSALLHSKAMAMWDVGKREEALKLIKEALEISPGDETLLKAKMELEPAVETGPIPEEGTGETAPEREITPADTGKAEPTKEEDILKEMVAQADNISEEETRKIHPTVRFITKSAESMEAELTEEEIKLKQSFTYLILEERSSKSYRLFKMNIDKGMPGYCVTRTFPEKVRDRYELTVPILWLSNVAKEEAVRPKDLEKLSLSLEEFLGKEGGIILLDGIEYLITNNNFITVLKLIQSLRDQVAINRSILLLSLNPSTMDNHQINLLKREVDSVIE